MVALHTMADEGLALAPCESARAPSLRHSLLEGFVREAYRSHFGARLASVMPELCALTEADGRPRAVAGLRCAGEGPLFLEQYLDASVEASIAGATGTTVDRAGIWEVGNLATRCPGAARQLVLSAAALLAERGAVWVAFTGTRRVLAVFRRLAVPLVTLAEAEACRVRDDGTYWGSYYSHHPRVVAGLVRHGLPSAWPRR